MAWKKSLLSLTALSIGISLELATLTIASAQASVRNSLSPRTWQVSQFNPPDRGAPTTAVGGATRGNPLCGEVLALSPEVRNRGGTPEDRQDPSKMSYSYLGLTVSEQPSFLFYAKGSDKYKGAEVTFVLTDLNGAGKTDNEDIYETKFTLPDRTGTIQLNLPSGIVLEEGKSYEWYMEMACPGTEGEVSWMNGFVERVEETPALKDDLAMAKTASARALVYSNAGLWFDALKVLAQERRVADTPELENSWKALLQYAAIDNSVKNSVVNAELIDCCSAESASETSDFTIDR